MPDDRAKKLFWAVIKLHLNILKVEILSSLITYIYTCPLLLNYAQLWKHPSWNPHAWLYTQLMYLRYWLLDNLYSFTSYWIYIKYLSSLGWHFKWEVSNIGPIIELICPPMFNTVLIPRIREIEWTVDTERQFPPRSHSHSKVDIWKLVNRNPMNK